jgi:hypothetical protein
VRCGKRIDSSGAKKITFENIETVFATSEIMTSFFSSCMKKFFETVFWNLTKKKNPS